MRGWVLGLEAGSPLWPYWPLQSAGRSYFQARDQLAQSQAALVQLQGQVADAQVLIASLTG